MERWTWTTANSGPDDEYGCATRGPVDMDTFVSNGYCGNPELVNEDGDEVISAGSGEYNPVRGDTLEIRARRARLIAAAPDLLEAVQEALDYTDGDEGPAVRRLRVILRAAIAKATGQGAA